MFHSARLKLTGWYLLIIMLISVLFSIAIFYILTREINAGYRRVVIRIEARRELLGEAPIPPVLDTDELAASQERLKMNLLYINLIILGVSAVAGYFLAGRTLKPIQEMVDEQDRFITDASHELRTPLTALRSEIEVNLRDKNLTLKEAKNLLSSNLEEVMDLQSLSEGLLLLTQYQRGAKAIKLDKASLFEVAEEACKKVSALYRGKDIEVRNNIGKVFMEGDRQSLVQLLVIFLDNAIKYSPNKTVIELNSKIVDRTVEIDVKDQGMGIEEKDLPHLFDRFYRADKSRVRGETGGYGLGLSIAKKIIELHNGEIAVNSKVGKGTTFKLSLPAVGS